MVLWRPGTILAPFSLLANTEYKMSLTSVDLPDPLTPVTATNAANGKVTSIFCKLFSLASFTIKDFFGSISLRFFGIAITDLPDK